MVEWLQIQHAVVSMQFRQAASIRIPVKYLKRRHQLLNILLVVVCDVISITSNQLCI